jgi:tetratricopeptide (TPR) repeat protein
MEQVTLRDYCEEARSLVQSGESDRAIHITRYILHHYPRHVDSYRVLGQALLTAGNYQEASRQFRRVLSADPEDVAARIGLAEIYQATGDLDKAIWQMQRATDLSPGDSALRMQLRRLLNTRQGGDAVEQLEITRAALGRIYARGGLYAKAVQEFKAVLEQNPARVDVQASLAEALWRDGRHLEAAEVCHRILERLPNALKANLIIGALWLESSQTDEAEPHLRLAQALDPENIVAQSLFGEKSPLLPLPVKIERLGEEEIEGAQLKPPPIAPAESMPAFQGLEPAIDWMSKLHEEDATFMMSDEKRPDDEFELPDWLQGVGDDLLEEEEDQAAAPSSPERDAVEEDETPAWLENLVARAEETRESGASVPAEPGEMPDWLQELRPEVPEEAPADLSTPDWLASIAAGQSPDEPESESIPGPPGSVPTPITSEAQQRDRPDAWAESEEQPESSEIAAEPMATAEEGRALWEQLSTEEVPPPEAEVEEATTLPLAEEAKPTVLEPVGDIVEESDVPDWLREIAAGEAAPSDEAEPPATTAATFPEVEVDETGLPDWLRDFEKPVAEEREPETQVVLPEATGEPLLGVGEGRALWEQILAEEGVDLTSAEEMLPSAAEGMTAEEWLRSTADLAATPSPPTAAKPAAERPPVEEAETPTMPVAETEVGEAEPPDWLREVAAGKLASAEEGEPETPTAGVELPEWLRELQEPEAEVEPLAEALTPEAAHGIEEALEVEVDEAGLPDWLREPSIEAADSLEPELGPSAEMPEWLAELEGEETLLAEPAFEEPIELETGEMPEWLGEVMAEETSLSEEWAAASGIAMPVQAEAREEQIPEWLRHIREGEEEEEGEPALEEVAELETPSEAEEHAEEAVQPGLPDWLRRLREGVSEMEPPAPAEQPVAEAPVQVEAAPPVEVLPEPETIQPEAAGPEWLGELVRDEEGLAELEEIEEEVAPAEAAAPTLVEYAEAAAAEEPPAAPLEIEPEPVEAAEAPSTRPLEPLRAEDLPEDSDARLAMARAALNAGDWSEALMIYETLVSSSELLDSVIEDMQAGVRRHAEDAAGYQLLGDAFMKDGRLQDALKAYRTALAQL